MSACRFSRVLPPQAVARSSQFVDDVKRLRRAGGLEWQHPTWSLTETTTARHPFQARETGKNARGAAALATTPPRQPRALAEELGVTAIVDRLNKAAAAREGGAGAGERCTTAATSSSDDPRRTLSAEDQQQHSLSSSPPLAKRSPPLPPPPEPSTPKRPQEDVERLRRAVRDAISSAPSQRRAEARGGSGRGGGGGAAAAAADGFGGEGHSPQWSQKHEACLCDMRRRLRETGSPLLRAKDPAVLIGALLRRQVREARDETGSM